MSSNIENKKKLHKLLARLAPKVGAKFIVEPEWGVAAQMVYSNGVVRSFLGYLLDLNGIASTGISTDKSHAKFFMSKLGYPVAEGKTIFENSWAKEMQSNRKILYAIKYAKSLGYPVIVKPNSKSKGWGVCLVWNKHELRAALREVFKEDKVAIVERYLPGRDYRIVVLDGEIISAYERTPLSVIGDGRSSILHLLKRKILLLSKESIKIDLKDRRIKLKLKRSGYTFKTILPKNKKLYLLDSANLSSGGDMIEATRTISSGFKKIAIKLTKDMGLRFSGVDLMITRGDIAKNPKVCGYYIIEINSSPGLAPAEEKYLKILRILGKKE